MTEPIRHRIAAVNGVELAVLEAGDRGAPPIILSHGFPESAWSWRHQLPTLAAAGYHVIAPDQRGYGGSSCPTEVGAYGIDALCDDLLGLVDETGHDQAVFVGHVLRRPLGPTRLPGPPTAVDLQLPQPPRLHRPGRRVLRRDLDGGRAVVGGAVGPVRPRRQRDDVGLSRTGRR